MTLEEAVREFLIPIVKGIVKEEMEKARVDFVCKQDVLTIMQSSDGESIIVDCVKDAIEDTIDEDKMRSIAEDVIENASISISA